MQARVYTHLQSHPDLAHFVRFNPIWYRYLTRNPDQLDKLEKEAKKFYGNTFSHRLQKWSDQVQMAEMLIHFADALKD